MSRAYGLLFFTLVKFGSLCLLVCLGLSSPTLLGQNSSDLEAHRHECRMNFLIGGDNGIETVSNWTQVDWDRNRGQWLELGSSNDVAVVTTNQILFIEDLPRGAQQLVQRLLKRATQVSTLNRARRLRLQQFQVLSAAIDRFEDVPAEAQRRFFKDNAELRFQSVEYGAWRVTTKSGEVFTAVHSSHMVDQIYAQDVTDAINGLVSSHHPKLRMEDVQRLEYFHNHPNVDPLSLEDIESNERVASLLRLHNPDVRVSIYAIVETDNGIRLFHNVSGKQ